VDIISQGKKIQSHEFIKHSIGEKQRLKFEEYLKNLGTLKQKYLRKFIMEI
jgi:hypothetical protein